MKPPTVVFGASYLLAGVAAVTLVSAVGAFFAIPEISHVQTRLARDAGAGALAGLGLMAFGLLAVVFSTLCVLLAVFDSRGRNVARILTWVLGGLTICVNIALLLVDAFDSVPWYATLIRIVAATTLLFTAGSLTLFAMPSANRYFRAARAPTAYTQDLDFVRRPAH